MTNMLNLSLHSSFPGESSSSQRSRNRMSTSTQSFMTADAGEIQPDESAASLQLAIALQLAEVEQALAVSVGKGKAPETEEGEDEDVALREYERELEGLARFEFDARLAKEVDEEVGSESEDEAEREREREKERQDEERMVEDRRLALALERGMISDEESRGSVSQERLLSLLGPLEKSLRDIVNLNDEDIKPMNIVKNVPSLDERSKYYPNTPRFLSHPNDTQTTIAGPSTTPAEKRALDDWVECDACNEEFLRKHALLAPCTHYYCIDCLKKQFLVARHDESVFPVKCCKSAIPFSLIREYLSKVDVEYYLEKAEEYSTKQRVYCANTDCGAFIKTADIDPVENVAVCGMCQQRTCAACKREAHEEGEDCPEDKDLTLCLEAAVENGWQRCPNCKTLVELAYGCRHMTCRCKSEWCYSCKATWKTCDCSDFQE